MARSVQYELVVDPAGSEASAARDCEAAVFLETYGNTTGQLEREYGPYDADSVFLAVLDEAGRAVAACRLIVPGAAGLKSVNDVCGPPWVVDAPRALRAAGVDVTRTWDVATIAVRRDAGPIRAVAAAAIYHGLWVAARANGAEFIVMIMDERARRLLGAAGIRTQRFPGTAAASYLGSASSTPVFGRLSTMADTQRRTDPDAHRLIAQGIGLDGIAVPGPDGFLLRDRSRAASSWQLELVRPLTA